MNYSQSIKFLYGLQWFGMKFGLRGIRRLLTSLDNPHHQFPAIHIAGTNGKGSTASMIASIFTAAGYRTGLYTSPHLISFNERIRIDGKPIPNKCVARLASNIVPVVQQNHCTFFEAVTAIAFRYFADEHVDIAIIETGLGGRLDATNVITPLVSVITTLGLEHTHILGQTIQKIAQEKGGIIKRGVSCITGVTSQNALQVLQRIAKQKKASLHTIHSKHIHFRRATISGSIVDVQIGKKKWKKLHVELAGLFQQRNIVLALQTILSITKSGQYTISDSDIRRGLGNIHKYSGIFARCSVILKKPFMIADVAHNPDAIKNLVSTLMKLKITKVRLVFGVMKDKDAQRMVKALAPITSELIAVVPKTERARSAAEIEAEFRRAGVQTIKSNSIGGAIKECIKQGQNRRPILITGSHFVVGEALASLNSKKYLTINQ